MSKVDIKRLDSVTKNDTTATEQINDNFQALQAAIENTVSRDGTVPNYMDADLDLNSYRIINVGAPVGGKDVVTLEYFEEKAGGAIEAVAEAKASASKAASSAQSALVASNNAIGQVAKAESLLLSAQTQLTDTKQYVDAAKADIDSTVEAGKQEINTTIDDAQMSLSDTINQAVEDVKTEAVNAANAVIEEAGATATQIATNNINDYTMNTVVPQLNTFVEAAEEDAKSADEDAKAAEDWAKTSKIWATGEDAEVNTVAPGEEEHSSRGYADLAMAIANTPEDVPVDTSKLLALDVIRGPKGDSGDAEFSGDVSFIGTFDVHSDNNHPLKVTGMAGTSASGFQIVDSNGLGDSDFEHYATGDRYGTRITNHNNTSDTSVSVDLYQSNVGKSVLDASAVDTVLVKDLQVDGADVVKTSGNQIIDGSKIFTSSINIRDTEYDRLTNPSAERNKTLVWEDKNGYDLGYINQKIATDGTNTLTFNASTYKTDGTRITGAISVTAKRDGTVYTYAPTPGSTRNDNTIATTGWVRSNSVPAGTVIAFAANTNPSGYILCNGAAVSRTTYASLFAVIGTTYGAGDGSTTFNLPNLTDKFIQGSGTAGTSKVAGLPNITGKFTVGNTQQPSITPIGQGAFVDHGVSGGTQGASWTAAGTYYDFDASKSNAIYGKSTTVQPPALTMRYYIKY